MVKGTKAMCMKWTRKSIAKWHADTFPHCSAENQRFKAGLEVEEYLKAKDTDEKLFELADWYIVNVALAERFHDSNAKLVCEMLENPHFSKYLRSAVQGKMNVNAKRRWEKVGNEWRHVEDNTVDIEEYLADKGA